MGACRHMRSQTPHILSFFVNTFQIKKILSPSPVSTFSSLYFFFLSLSLSLSLSDLVVVEEVDAKTESRTGPYPLPSPCAVAM